MISELVLFAACFALGLLSRFWYVGLARLQKRIGRAAGTALEFVSMGLLAAAFVVILFFLSDGVLMPYSIIAVVAGFLATAIFV